MMLRLALQLTKTVYATRSVVAKLKAQLRLFRSFYLRVGGRRRLRFHIRKVGADGAANDDDGPLPAREMAVAA
jgi:hypothetical protein